MGFKEQLEKNKIPAVKVIAEYLMTRPDLKEKLENPKKSLKEMFNYIMSQAKQQARGRCVCLADDIVFGMAVHYYDEDNVEFNKDIEALVDVSKPVEKQKTVEKNGRTKKSMDDNKKKKFSDIAEGQVSLF